MTGTVHLKWTPLTTRCGRFFEHSPFGLQSTQRLADVTCRTCLMLTRRRR